MSPANLPHPHHHQQHSILNGLRPSPLKINKESHLIHKLSSSTPSSSIAPLGGGAGAKQLQRNHPIIIYTHSPKVIHTQAKDFMALVQKLTGLSSSRNDENAKQGQESEGVNFTTSNKGLKAVVGDDKESSCGVDDISPVLKPPKNPYFADTPLFTPHSVDFFCSPRPVYRYPDSGYASPSMANSIPPPVHERAT
ncbi:hypothetical protein P3X46_023019 [Hevea brasiliensis]|uniref:VQ domain-containing protein n=1 Tax=Hevea brasiliensis TaxID=3981 RepID=A0ABQ9LAR7_HEVBR|nr:hypothetical protein P3X46_023019 [Hevea brasiliensis]